MELAKTKVQFYEEPGDPLGGSISRTHTVQDLNCEEQLKILNQNASLSFTARSSLLAW